MGQRAPETNPQCSPVKHIILHIYLVALAPYPTSSKEITLARLLELPECPSSIGLLLQRRVYRDAASACGTWGSYTTIP